ncbi:MAG: insulinase family protein, partial [Acidobacteria bacterium]|nr:insulinase family protein [Acidobacteriota bacterium]
NIQSNRKESVLKNTRKELFKLLYGENTAEGQEVSRVSYTKISTKDVISFYKKYYIPSNCFIGISSSLPLENIEQVISKTFFALSNGGTQKCPIADKADNESIVVILQKTGLEKSVLGVGKKINLPQGDQLLEDLPKLELVTAIINSDSPSARLVKQFMVDRNLAEILDFSFYVSKNPKKGYYLVFLYPDSKRVGFSAYIVGRVFSDLITNPPTLEELNQGKMALLGNFNFIASDPERLLETNMDFILRGFPPNYLKTYSKILIGCTADDLVKICKEYLSMTKYQYVIYGSGENFSREMSVFGKVTIRNASIEN